MVISFFETPNTPGDPQNSGNLINANVNINFNGKDSAFNGSAYQYYPGIENNIGFDEKNHYGKVSDLKCSLITVLHGI